MDEFTVIDTGRRPGSGPPSLGLLLIFLLLSIIIGSLAGTLLIQLTGAAMGLDLTEVMTALNPDSPQRERDFVRLAHLITHVMTFALPSLFTVWFFYRRYTWRFLRLHLWPRVSLIFGGMLFILASFPLAQLSYWLNQRLPLPDWMMGLETDANQAIEALLVMDTPWVFAFNVLVIAVLPAVGEELLFRGVLQQQVERRFGRPVLAVWVAAVVFSAFHLQFAGFIPRLLLGALLGYLMLWTRSLWVPIAAHLVFNGSQIAARYWVGEELVAGADADTVLTANWVSGLFSLLALLLIGYWLRQQVPAEPPPGQSVMGNEPDRDQE